MHLLKSQMRLKDMLMENFQKMMKFGWKRKNLRDRDGADMCSRARIKFPIVMSGQISIMDLLHQGLPPRRPRYCKIYTKYAYASRELS